MASASDKMKKIFEKVRVTLGFQTNIDPNAQKVFSAIKELKKGEKHRFHLRLLSDGRGILTVDAEFIIYLNQTAMIFFRDFIQGKPLQETQEYFVKNYRVSSESISDDYNDVLNKVDLLLQQQDVNPVTDLGFLVQDSSIVNEFPLRVYLALTYRYNTGGDKAYPSNSINSEELDTTTMKQVIDKLYEIGVPQITLSGGEPTLYKDFIDLIAYGEQKGVIMGMLTNGVSFAKDSLVKESIKKGLDYVQINLQSHDPAIHNQIVGTDNYNTIIQAIKNFEAADIYLAVNTTLCPLNINKIEETVKFLHKLKVSVFNCNTLINPVGRDIYPHGIDGKTLSDTIVKLQKLTKELGMEFNFNSPTPDPSFNPLDFNLGLTSTHPANTSITIAPNGDVLAVQHQTGAVGNILRDDWNTIWYSKAFKEIRKKGLKPSASESELLTFLDTGTPLLGLK